MDRLRTWFTINLSKVKIYDLTLWKNYLATVGAVSTFVTLISFFATAQTIFSNISTAAILFGILLVIIFLYLWWSANHKSSVDLRINNTKVHIAEGDIWELFDEEEEKREELSVIAVNDCYDTIVDNRIIAAKSLHGQYIKRIMTAGKLEQLEMRIESDPILNRGKNRKPIPERECGRKYQYPVGSVLEFDSYVLAAFTSLDEKNKAYLTSEDYTSFWLRFWENIDEIYAGRTINIPLIGAGISRFRNGKPTKQELMEIMLWTLKISGFHNTYGDKQINFIIYPSDAEEIDFYHIQHNRNFR